MEKLNKEKIGKSEVYATIFIDVFFPNDFECCTLLEYLVKIYFVQL